MVNLTINRLKSYTPKKATSSIRSIPHHPINHRVFLTSVCNQPDVYSQKIRTPSFLINKAAIISISKPISKPKKIMATSFLLPPTPFKSIQEFALKTIPSTSKIEIRRIIESLYGFDVAKVRTLNMEGKKKKRAGYLVAKSDYKKPSIKLNSFDGRTWYLEYYEISCGISLLPNLL